VYLTAAGYFGCVAPPGDRLELLRPGGLDLDLLDRELGEQALRLPGDSLLGAGVEPSDRDSDQRMWWYAGGNRTVRKVIVRAGTRMQDRLLEVGGFRLPAFVCGEICDGGAGSTLSGTRQASMSC